MILLVDQYLWKYFRRTKKISIDGIKIEDYMETKSTNILGVRVDYLRKTDIHNRIIEIIALNRKAIIGNVNVHAINLAFSDHYYKEIINSCEHVFCDGFGIMLGARILDHKIFERITYADWTWDLVNLCVVHDLTLYLLGGKPGIAEKAASRIFERFPDIRILGFHHGYFDKTHEGAENQDVINEINSLNPNILIVGMGMPVQEYWLRENIDSLEINVALTGGAVFDYISGELKRAPVWMTRNGLEWLGRLFIEPKRLWKRYLVGNPIFLWRVFLQRLGLLSYPDFS